MLFDDGCGRYSIQASAEELRKRYNLAKAKDKVTKSFDVKPGQMLPVITADESGKPQMELMKWGLIPFWSKDPKLGYRLFNARDDHLFDGKIWRQVIYKKRAIIPATGFFEWTKPEKGSKTPKQKFYFHPKQIDIFSFAGIWETWKDVEGKEWKTYSIITTEPNKEMSSVHNRMPVILHPEDESSWLEPSKVTRDDIEPLLRPFEDNGLEKVEVSNDVKDVRFDDKQLIAPLNSK